MTNKENLVFNIKRNKILNIQNKYIKIILALRKGVDHKATLQTRGLYIKINNERSDTYERKQNVFNG